jgi:hypothetical protein
MKQNLNRDTQQAGQDIRTGYEQSKQDLKQSAEDVKSGAADVGDRAADKTEQAGAGLAQGIREGSDSLRGEHKALPMGALSSGKDVRNTLTTDPIATVTGDGLNLDYMHSLGNKFDWDLGGRFARTQLGGAAATSFGVKGGVDYFIIGRHNEGLRIGPRVELGLGGTSQAGAGSTLGSFAAGGELGYNWIASNGLTAGLAGGLRELVGGQPVSVAGAPSVASSFGPYGKLNLGYSW